MMIFGFTCSIVYYQVFGHSSPLSLKSAFDSADDTLGRILTRKIAPPKTIAVIKRYIAQLEGLDASLFDEVYLDSDGGSDEPLPDGFKIPLSGSDDMPGLNSDIPLAIIMKKPHSTSLGVTSNFTRPESQDLGSDASEYDVLDAYFPSPPSSVYIGNPTSATSTLRTHPQPPSLRSGPDSHWSETYSPPSPPTTERSYPGSFVPSKVPPPPPKSQFRYENSSFSQHHTVTRDDHSHSRAAILHRSSPGPAAIPRTRLSLLTNGNDSKITLESKDGRKESIASRVPSVNSTEHQSPPSFQTRLQHPPQPQLLPRNPAQPSSQSMGSRFGTLFHRTIKNERDQDNAYSSTQTQMGPGDGQLTPNSDVFPTTPSPLPPPALPLPSLVPLAHTLPSIQPLPQSQSQSQARHSASSFPPDPSASVSIGSTPSNHSSSGMPQVKREPQEALKFEEPEMSATEVDRVTGRERPAGWIPGRIQCTGKSALFSLQPSESFHFTRTLFDQRTADSVRCIGLFMDKARKITIAKSGAKLVDGMRLWVDTRALKIVNIKGDNCTFALL